MLEVANFKELARVNTGRHMLDSGGATGSLGIKPTWPASAIDIQNIRPKVTTNCPKLVFLQFKLPLALLNKCVYAVSN